VVIRNASRRQQITRSWDISSCSSQITVSDRRNPKNTTLGESGRQAIFSAAFVASVRLIRCWDIWEKLAGECDKLEREHQPPQNKQVATIPSVVGLQHVVETFLYEAKNFIRDLTGVINAGYGTVFDQASEFCEAKGGGKIRRWAVGHFGPEDRLTRFLALHETWLWEVVQMRNAVEHPKGRSGMLHVANYEMVPEGILRPTWHREANQPTYIVSDMAILCDHMLRFAEELTIYIIEKHLHLNMLQIYEIPESERNAHCPRRFDIGLTENMAKQFAAHFSSPALGSTSQGPLRAALR
jgi:hypothetical protein